MICMLVKVSSWSTTKAQPRSQIAKSLMCSFQPHATWSSRVKGISAWALAALRMLSQSSSIIQDACCDPDLKHAECWKISLSRLSKIMAQVIYTEDTIRQHWSYQLWMLNVRYNVPASLLLFSLLCTCLEQWQDSFLYYAPALNSDRKFCDL